MAKKPTVYKNYINGKWVASVTGETFENRQPADTTANSSVFSKISSDRDVNTAVDAAHEAYRNRGVSCRRRSAPRFSTKSVNA